MTIRTIIAVDEGPAGDAALAWATRRAQWVKDPLLLVHVVDESTLVPGKVLDPARFGRAGALLDAAAEQLRGTVPGIDVRTEVISGDVVPSLIALTAADALLVIGENTRGSVRSSIGWSAGVRVAAHATGPVAVVPAEVTEDRRGVVVGVDDTDQCLDVAEIAALEALATGQPLQVVHAWMAPNMWLDTFPLDEEFMAFLAEPHQRLLDDIVGVLRGRHPSLDVTGRAVHGIPAQCILDADPLPALVVVGTRGKSLFQRLRLGSVSRDLLLNLDVPAIVVPTATVITTRESAADTARAGS
ncbi:universal stress protein [Herbiconiux sp. VKM Ac-1786]|uniref:universal stress protein n=1 Tax=Herbiconiux sp. VKM Ac-1786 TaxID=2783824 RepID=UPI00188A89B1|nr:universal stress protein [Herbiconiux sp. VKM Ac-1786]MBF4571957.1 universal stress protein [Herbiconiux sp. VKM Ac-1786]